ncbi:MAG: hypothetical protein VW546_02895 [Gammaproteobacteria bacterium]
MKAVFKNQEISVGFGAGLLVLALMFPPALELTWRQIPNAIFGVAMLAGVFALVGIVRMAPRMTLIAQLLLLLSALRVALDIVHLDSVQGSGQLGLWLWVSALGFAVWHVMKGFSSQKADATPSSLVDRIVVPALFGVWFLALWEFITTGLGIPRVLLPSPSLVGESIAGSLNVLGADFNQTVVRAVIPGFLMGNLAGFAAALAAESRQRDSNNRNRAHHGHVVWF